MDIQDIRICRLKYNCQEVIAEPAIDQENYVINIALRINRNKVTGVEWQVAQLLKT